MSAHDKLDLLFAAVGALYIATWLILSGWASVSLGDAVRTWTGSRRRGVIATRLLFVSVGIGGAVVIQAVLL
ncbi:hypothetical protein LDO31_02820 [Luteimonas sp. XNQY3]|nr:hypothetical protein [Luteimonas sp. XNQY3]MCD9005179.1 hypothetical protein [Luteimonas sp. XNQY3]